MSASPPRPLLASDLFAISQGTKNEGMEECHWCGAPCTRDWEHQEPPPIPFVRYITHACRPGNPWVCRGCHMFRRPRVTVRYFGGSFRDGQSPQLQSWFVTEEGAWTIRPGNVADAAILYEQLLTPPLRFLLAVVTEPGELNQLHLAAANDHPEGVRGDCPLVWMLNNRPLIYSPYELEQALRHGSQGREPGARELIRLFGGFELPPIPDESLPQKTGQRGRPKGRDVDVRPDGRISQKPVTARSGS